MFDRTQRFPRARITAAVLLTALVLAGCGAQGNNQNSLEPKGPNSRKILDLFTPFFWVAVVIGIGVVGATIYVAVKFRERPGEERNPKQVHGNTALEVGWTIVPALILAVMAVPTVALVFDLAEKPDAEALRVNVTAKQWWWEFEYPDTGVVTANELRIPAGRPVELSLTSPDTGVIHSFWVPSLNGKKDVVPGRTTSLKLEADEPGTYLGQCAEYCGVSHANMRIRVIAQTEAGFGQWVADQQQALSGDAVAFAEQLNSTWGCSQCHAFDGVEGATARIGPNLTRVGDRSTFAGGIFETSLENLTNWVYDAPGQKPAGPLQGWMPSFKDAGMTREQAAEIARFLLCDTATDPSANPECEG